MPQIVESKKAHYEEVPTYEVFGTRERDGETELLIYRYGIWTWVLARFFQPVKQ